MNDLPKINYTALAEALLSRSEELVSAWLPGGTQRGHEYVCADLSGGVGSSTSVNLKTGRWSDFAGDEKGSDLLSLYAAIHHLSQSHAALAVAREEGLEDVAGIVMGRSTTGTEPSPRPPKAPVVASKPKNDEGWQTVVPVPANAPQATFQNAYRAPETVEHTAEYRIDGHLYGYVVRFRTSDGGKETLPYTWCTSAKDGCSRWHWRQFDAPRPLYFPGGKSPSNVANPMPTVVVVEGEKKAGILQTLLDQSIPGVYVVVSWAGGAKAWNLSDWKWLKGCGVLLWPDCDAHRVRLTKAERDACADDAARKLAQEGKPLVPLEKQPGMAAMLGIGAMLRDTLDCKVQLLPIPAPLAVPAGWDCADAIQTDGWDGARVLAFFGQAQGLPKDAVASAAKTKKIDGPVGTESVDSEHSGFTLVGKRRIPNWLMCYYDEAKSKWLTSRKMVIHVLENDPLLAPVLAYNDLTNNIQSCCAWPWPFGVAGDVTDSVDLMLGKYLSDTYGMPSIARAALEEAITTVAHTRRFHPIRVYLRALKWDGKQRIDKWLMYAIGESPESLSRAEIEYLQIVGRCWLLGMVKRVLEPGCKFDYCPVLEGTGGLRKSTLVEILASTEFYSDTAFEVGHGKEAQEQVRGKWLYEIAEMSGFSKAEVGAIKAFISSKMDRYRPAYGTTVMQYPRQCIMVGTTNENTYLRDRTGNRRFWPIRVRHMIKTEWVQKYRDQLFAEAYALVMADPNLVYTPTTDQERRLFAPMQASRLQESAVASELLNVFTRAPNATASGQVVNELTDFVTLAQVTQALGVDAAKCPPGTVGEIRSWFASQGWVSVKKQINGVRANGYVRPKDWPPQEDSDVMIEAPLPGSESSDTPPTAEDDYEPF
jgi:putative DNA primase/helicase